MKKILNIDDFTNFDTNNYFFFVCNIKLNLNFASGLRKTSLWCESSNKAKSHFRKC